MIDRFLRLFTPDPLSRSLKVYLSANGIFRALGIGRGVLLTWLMVQAEFGIYQLGLLLANILLPVLSLGLYEGVARFVPEYETKGRLWPFLKRALPIGVIIATGICSLLFLLSGWMGGLFVGSLATSENTINESIADQATLTQVVVFCVAVLSVYHLIIAILRGRRMFRAISAMELSAAILFTVFAVLAALMGQGRGVTILLIYTAANLVCAVLFGIPALLGVWQERPPPSDIAESIGLKPLVKYSLWAGCGAVCWQLLMSYPTLHLHRICGDEVFAIFSAMRVPTQVGYLAITAMGVAIASAVTKTWESAGRSTALAQLNLASKGGIAIVLLGCLIIAACKGLIILVFPADYRQGEGAVSLLLLYYLLAGAVGLVAIRFSLVKKSGLMFASWAVGCLVAVVLSFVCVDAQDPLHSLLMTAWASVGGAAAALIVALILLYRLQLLPDRGLLVLLAGTLLLTAPTTYIAAGGLALVLLTLSTSLIFGSLERQTLAQYILGRKR